MRATRVLSVSLEPARDGTAAETHLKIMADGFEDKGLIVKRVWRNQGAVVAGIPGFVAKLILDMPRSDVVYARWHPLDIVTPVLAKVFHKRLVLEVNGLVDDLLSNRPGLQPFESLVRLISRFSLTMASSAICVSSGLSAHVEKATGGRFPVRTLANGAIDRWGGPAPATSMAVSSPYVLYFGELAARQGITSLMRARASNYWPKGLSLVVAGDGLLRDQVEEAASESRCEYLGRLDASRLAGVIAGAKATFSLQDVSIFRNTVMGLPLKIPESLMAGVPVIASDLSDVPRHVAGVPGCSIVNPSDAEEVCGAVSRAVALDAQARTQIREMALERFSWDRAVDATIAVLLGG